MQPYANRRLTESPDVADIRCEGRATHVGRAGSQHGYIRKSATKAATRRHLKRADRAKALKNAIAEIAS